MRRLAAFALPYCAAVFLAQYVLPRPLWLPAGALCALLALCALPLRGDGRLRALLIAFGLAAGFLWCRGYDAYFYAPAEELDGRTVILEAVATDWAEPAAYGYSVPVRIVLEGQPDVGALLYAGQAAAQLRPGDRVSVVAACRLAGRTASGQETAHYTSRGIFLTAAAYGEMTITSPTRIPVRYWPRLAARALRESAGRVFPADTAGFMTALILGEKAGLDDSLYAALRRTGLAHTVAVSGMHISFLAGLIGLVPGARRRRSRAAACMAVVFFYAAVTGGNPSVLRAAFQCACLQLAPLLGREEDTPTALSAVLALLLLQNPRAVTGIGLQMSFAAVAGIYLFSPRLYESWIGRLPRKGRQLPPVRALLGVLAATLGAMSFTIPISAYYFGTVSLIAPLSNLLAWPAVMAAFAAGLTAALAGIWFSGPGGALALAAVLPAQYVQALARSLSRLPFAAVDLGSVYYTLWLLFAYAVFCLCLFRRGEKGRLWLGPVAVVVVLCAAVAFSRLTVTAPGLTVAVLDVGQGQSVVLCSSRYAAVVDCGGNAAENAGDSAADYLQNLGRSHLDLLVLTHFHDDHANGVAQLMARMTVQTVAMPPPADERGKRIELLAGRAGAEIRYITQPQQLALGGTVVTLYPPLGGEGENENGLAMLCSAGEFDVLITGDMGAELESRLVRYRELPDIELFVAGHHGSKYSSSDTLLRAVTPELAVISTGRNSYGHPAPETLERLAGYGIEIYRTDLQGTVTVTVR